MKPGRSNAKGSDFERRVCRALTAWIDPTRKDGKPELFWRSATSGAKATQDRKAGRKANQGGDIIAVADEVLGTDHFWVTQVFSIECKDRKDYGNLDLLFTAQGEFLKWWKQAVDDAEQDKKQPLLIFKRYRGEVLIAHWGYSSKINAPLPSIIFIDGMANRLGISICLFTSWLASNKPDKLRAKFKPFVGHPIPKKLGKAGNK